MEKQTKNRILGALVIIGLVIILLPLFQNGNELVTETTLVNTPPFPDQPAQTDTAISESVPSAPMASNPSPQAMLSDTQPMVQNEAIANPIKTTNDKIIENPKPAPTQKKLTHLNNSHPSKIQPQAVHKSSTIALAKTTTEDNGLIKLNSAVWVLQIGSFKNKSNALRVVNQLRANGYRAFIQQISTALGEHTRVFVGPENKRTTARALADRLRSEMHIQAIVVSYKPLTL